LCGTACSLLPRDKVWLAPEVSLLLPLYNGADLVECIFIVLLLSNPLSILEVLLLKAFAMFLVEYKFLLARFKSTCDFLDQQLKGIRDVASPSCTFQIAAFFILPL
jgi:hypothetical protein